MKLSAIACLAAGMAALGLGWRTGRALADRPPARRPAPRPVDPRELAELKSVAAGAPSPDPVRDLLRRAAARDDHALLRYAEELLREWVGGDVERALTLLAWIRRTAARPELDVLFEALSRSEAFQNPRVLEAVVRLLEEDADGPRRALAAFALRNARRLADGLIERLEAVARAGPPEGVLHGLAQAFGAVRAGEALLGLAELPEAREPALESLSLIDPAVSARQVARLEAWLASDPNPQVRALAAAALGAAGDDGRDRVLALYEQAFMAEGDPYVRHVLLTHAARLGGQEALPVLERMARRDPYFAPDVREYAEIFRTAVDWDRVGLEKAARDALAQRIHPWEGCKGEPR